MRPISRTDSGNRALPRIRTCALTRAPARRGFRRTFTNLRKERPVMAVASDKVTQHRPSIFHVLIPNRWCSASITKSNARFEAALLYWFAPASLAIAITAIIRCWWKRSGMCGVCGGEFALSHFFPEWNQFKHHPKKLLIALSRDSACSNVQWGTEVLRSTVPEHRPPFQKNSHGIQLKYETRLRGEGS